MELDLGREEIKRGPVHETPLPASQEEDEPWLPSDSEEEEPYRPLTAQNDQPRLPSDREEEEPYRAPTTENDEPWLPSDSEEDEPYHAPTTGNDEPWLPSDSEEEDDTNVDVSSRSGNAIGSQSGNNHTEHTTHDRVNTETRGCPPRLVTTSEGQNTARNDIPTTESGFPMPSNKTSYFNWVIDRYKSWVEHEDQPKGKDKIRQICSTFDISDKGEVLRNLWSSQWRAGTVSFNRSNKAINFPNEDFTTYPWGLPAQKLYQAAEKRRRFRGDTLYEKPFRDLLWRIEEWYFSQLQTDYDNLQVRDITEWELAEPTLKDLNDFLGSLD